MHRHLPQPLSYHRKHTAIAKDIRIYSPPGAFGRDWHVHEVPRVAGAAQFDHNREPGEAEESGHRPHRERLRYEQGPQTGDRCSETTPGCGRSPCLASRADPQATVSFGSGSSSCRRSIRSRIQIEDGLCVIDVAGSINYVLLVFEFLYIHM